MKGWASIGVYVYSSERKQWTLVYPSERSPH
jgi:hypothetical protein